MSKIIIKRNICINDMYMYKFLVAKSHYPKYTLVCNMINMKL